MCSEEALVSRNPKMSLGIVGSSLHCYSFTDNSRCNYSTSLHFPRRNRPVSLHLPPRRLVLLLSCGPATSARDTPPRKVVSLVVRPHLIPSNRRPTARLLENLHCVVSPAVRAPPILIPRSRCLVGPREESVSIPKR